MIKLIPGMIVGDGDIASVLKPREGFLYFASGVSNSQETRESEYEKEKKLLLSQPRDRRIVYFSSLSIFYSDGRYQKHKREMEKVVKANFYKHCIIRVGNITWGNNPNTILNFFLNRIEEGLPLEIRDEDRYLIDKEKFLYWINMIPNFNCEMNIPGITMSVREIVKSLL